MGKESRKHNLPGPFYGKHLLQNPVFHVFLVCFTGLVVYSNTFTAPFQWDEYHFLIANPLIKNLDYFISPLRAAHSEYYPGLIGRYVGYLSFALNYHFHGFDVVGYHIVNILIHILSALSLYLLVTLTFRTPRLARSGIGGRSGEVALFTSLLFVSHPLQIEAVTYVFQRFASLVALFYLVSMIMYVKGRLITDGLPPANAGKSRGRPAVYFLFSFIFAVLAMKTKENAFTLPLVIILYDFFFFNGPLRKRILYGAPLLLTMAIIPLTLIGVDRPLGRIIGAAGSATRGATYISRSSYLFTQFRVVLTYLRLLAFPINQDIDYSYPVYHSFFNFHVLLSFLIILSIACAAFYMFFSSRRGAELRVVSFGLLFFLVALSVESGIIPIPMLIDEYRVYLPSAGMFLAAAVSVYYLSERSARKGAHRIAVLFLAVVVMLYSAAAYTRNETWGSRIGLWQDAAGKSPGTVTPHFVLGTIYESKGDLDKAKEQYDMVLRHRPDDVDTRINLGNIYKSEGMIDKAVEQYDIALRLKPGDAITHNNLGNAYNIEGLYDKAMEQFLIAVRLNPDLAEAYFNLGLLYIGRGDLVRARAALEKGLRLRPDDYRAARLLQSISRQGESKQN